MQLPREPRFRPVQMLDEWPFARPQTQRQGPAQRDNIKELLYEGAGTVNQNQNKQQQQPLGRRDPNQQSDPALAEQEHPWQRCRIKKVEPLPQREQGHGKKVNNFDINNNNNNHLHSARPNSSSVAPWENPNSMSALEKKYAGYEYPLQKTRESSVESNQQTYGFDPTSSSSSSSTSTSCASAARRRAQLQAQGSDWFALTKNSASQQQHQQQQQHQDSENLLESVGPKVGEPVHLRNYYSASEQRLTSSRKLIQQMQVLARTTGRCNGALWQSCLEGHILRKPFCKAPTTRDVLRNHNNVNNFDADVDPLNQQQRIRRTLPFVELIVQLEDALSQQVCEKALADVLGLGEFCNDNTPVRYEHFLKLFNA